MSQSPSEFHHILTFHTLSLYEISPDKVSISFGVSSYLNKQNKTLLSGINESKVSISFGVSSYLNETYEELAKLNPESQSPSEFHHILTISFVTIRTWQIQGLNLLRSFIIS